MGDLALLAIPRLDDGQGRARFRSDVEIVASTGTPVLVTPFWPARRLAIPWIEHLTALARQVRKHIGAPSLLAELPPALFEQLSREHRSELLDATTGFVDQLFRDDSRKPPNLRDVKKRLSTSAPERIRERLLEVGIIERGHFKLPSGFHSDTNIKFGDFETVDGGHGLAAFMTTFLARRLRSKAPGTLVYWGGSTLSLLAETLATYLSGAQRPVTAVSVQGDYDSLSVDETVFDGIEHDRSVVLLGDIAASTRLSARMASLLQNDADSTPSAIATFVALSSAIAPLSELAREYNSSLHIVTEVNAQLWASSECPLCLRGDEPIEVRPEARRDVKVFGPLAYQPPRARVLGSAIGAGQVGARRDEDPRHLHDSYLRPGTSPDHIAALLDDNFIFKLKEIDFDYLMYHDTETANAMVARIRTALFEKQFGEHRLRRRDDRWVLDRPIPRDARILFIDDGANMGRAILQVLDTIDAAGAHAAGILVFEDKMPEWAHKAVRRACAGAGPEGADTVLLFVHRSPHTQEGVLEGACKVCDFRALVRLLAAIPGSPPYKQRAYANLEAELVCAGPFPDKLSVDVNRGDNAVEQLNAMLLATPDWLRIEDSIRLMNFIIQDFVPDLRDLAERADDSGQAPGLPSVLSALDVRWLERALLWLEPHEMQSMSDLVAVSPGLKLSASLNRLRCSENPSRLALALSRSMAVIEESPQLFVERYQDIVEHLLLAVVANDPARNAAAVLALLNRSTDGPLAQLRDDFEPVVNLLWQSRAKSEGPLFALLWPERMPLVDPSQELLANLRSDRWAVDASGREYSFDLAGMKETITDDRALMLAAVIVQGPLHTTAMRKFLKGARSPGSVKSQQQQFARLCQSVRVGWSGGAFVFSSPPRTTPKKREENQLATGNKPGLLLWRDGGAPPWSAITETVFGLHPNVLPLS